MNNNNHNNKRIRRGWPPILSSPSNINIISSPPRSISIIPYGRSESINVIDITTPPRYGVQQPQNPYDQIESNVSPSVINLSTPPRYVVQLPNPYDQIESTVSQSVIDLSTQLQNPWDRIESTVFPSVIDITPPPRYGVHLHEDIHIMSPVYNNPLTEILHYPLQTCSYCGKNLIQGWTTLYINSTNRRVSYLMCPDYSYNNYEQGISYNNLHDTFNPNSIDSAKHGRGFL